MTAAEHWAAFPTVAAPDVCTGRRELVFRPYIAVYQIREHTVEISRVYHGAQDWP
jgi:plasmid stabilization system protein ParE